MNSSIVNQIKTNLCLVLDQFFIAHTMLSATVHNLMMHTSVSVSTNNCSVDFYNGDLQTTNVLFTWNVSSHKTDWILTTRSLFCLDFVYTHANSLMKILELECSCIRLLENSIATSLLFVYCAHIVCCCVLIYLSIPFSLMLMC